MHSTPHFGPPYHGSASYLLLEYFNELTCARPCPPQVMTLRSKEFQSMHVVRKLWPGSLLVGVLIAFPLTSAANPGPAVPIVTPSGIELQAGPLGL